MKYLFLSACLFAALHSFDARASAIQVGITPMSVTAGNPVTVAVSGVVDPSDGIGAFTFDLSFASTISYVPGSLQLGSFLNQWLPYVGNGAGFADVSIADYPTDITIPDSLGASVLLFSVQLATSTSTLPPSQSVLVSPDVNDAGVPGAYQFGATGGSFGVTTGVTSVPEPGLTVMIPALLLLAAARRRT